jgi:hypothetical protein
MKLPILIWSLFAAFVGLAVAQVGTPNFSSVRATTGTLGQVTIASGTNAVTMTGTGGTLYLNGVAVGTGGGGVSTGTANLLIAGGTIGSGVTMGTGTATGGVLFAATGTTPQLSLANGTGGSATFQVDGTGLLTIDPSGATHRTYVSGDLFTNYFQLSGVNQYTPNIIAESPFLSGSNVYQFTAPSIESGNVFYVAATGTGSGSASALKLENTRTGSGPNVGLTINATGTNGAAIVIEAGKISNGSAGFSLPPTDGTNGQVLTFNGAGGTSWTTISGGTGGGTPGGSSGQVQYNDAGAFGGLAGLTVTGTAITATGLTLASGTTTLVGSIVGGTASFITAAGGTFGTLRVNTANSLLTSPVNINTTTNYLTVSGSLFDMNNTTASGQARLYGTSAVVFRTAAVDPILTLGSAGIVGAGSATSFNNGGFIVSGTGASALVTANNVQMQHATLAFGTSVNINFAGAGLQTISTATGTSMALTGSGYPSTGTMGRPVTVFVTAGTAALTITTGTAGWRILGTPAPWTVSANKMVGIPLLATGSTGGDVKASITFEE